MLSSSLTPTPAYLAEWMPGFPSSALTTRPESSAIAGRPDSAVACRALIIALSTKVVPVSATEAMPSLLWEIISQSRSPRILPISRSFPSLPLAITSFFVASFTESENRRFALQLKPLRSLRFAPLLFRWYQRLPARGEHRVLRE